MPTDLLSFLQRLRNAKIAFTLGCVRENAILVNIAVPGERWEVEFMDDDRVEVERFRSDGHMYDHSVFDELFSRFVD